MKLRMLADLQRRWWLGPTEQLTSFDPSSESIDVVDDDVESPSENQESEEPTVASQDQGEDNLPFPEMDNDDLHTEEGEQTILSDLKQFFAKCAALDPRGKRLSECSENEKAIVWNEILLEMEKEKVSIEPQVIPRSQIQKLRLSQQMFGTGQLNLGSAEEECARYRALAPAKDLLSNAFVWWREHKAQFPRLFALARRFLQIPATSAGVERNFSVTGGVANEKNARRSTELTDSLCSLSLNQPYWAGNKKKT